ncbi:MAG: PDZ domain-containing protein [Deltaproteobacteria bacterium]|nr:PDZ domain-containing protein [Deltaproteobacteria bacterium]
MKTDPREEAEGKPTEVLEWGLSIEPVTQAIRQELQRPDNKGVLIQGVRSGGPSDQAVPSLQSHDLILEVGGAPVTDVAGFLAATKKIAPPGATPVPTLVLVERRNEKLLTLVEVGIRTPQEPASEVRKAWLPVSTQVLTKKLAAAMGLKGKRGVRITQVFPQSSAEAAGFKVGDVVTHIDGVLIEASEPHDSDVFDGMIRQYKLGKAAEFTVIRDGKPMSLTVTLDEGPKPDREMRVYADEQLEFRARDVSLFDRVRSRWDQKQGGALVSQVEEGGWAAVGGLRTDDLILGVDGKAVAQLNDLQAGLKSAREAKEKRVVLLVRRGVHTLFVELEPKWM